MSMWRSIPLFVYIEYGMCWVRGQWLFMAKDCLQWQEVAMRFLKSNAIVLCIGIEQDGLTQLILAELGFKIQTLHVLWDWVACLGWRRTLSAKVSQQCVLCEHRSSMCQSSHFEQCMGGDVYGCDCKTQGSEWRKPPQSDDVMLAGSAGITSRHERICLSENPASLIWRKAFEWGADMSSYSMNHNRKHVQGDRSAKIIL